MNKYEETVTRFSSIGTTTYFHPVSTSQNSENHIICSCWRKLFTFGCTDVSIDNPNTNPLTLEVRPCLSIINQLNYTYWGIFQKQTFFRQPELLPKQSWFFMGAECVMSLKICLGCFSAFLFVFQSKNLYCSWYLMWNLFSSLRFKSTKCHVNLFLSLWSKFPDDSEANQFYFPSSAQNRDKDSRRISRGKVQWGNPLLYMNVE